MRLVLMLMYEQHIKNVSFICGHFGILKKIFYKKTITFTIYAILKKGLTKKYKRLKKTSSS